MEMQPSLRYTGIILAILAATGLTACGGGGSGTPAASNSGGTTTPIAAAVTLPSSAAPLTSKTNTNAVAALAGVSAAYRALSTGTVRAFTAPTASAYATDRAGTEVQVEGQQALDNINMILCYLNQAAPGLVLKAKNANTAGSTYIAKINNETCDSDPGGNNSKGSKFTTMTLVATPQTATAKETVKFWAELPSGNTPQRVHAKITATSGVTASNPFGVWTLDYDMEMKSPTKGWGPLKNGANPSTGTLQASAVGGQPQLLMYEDDAGLYKAAVKVRYDKGSKTAGQANLSVTDAFSGTPKTTSNVLAFNTGYADIGKNINGATTSICRDRTKFVDHVYRYQLYYAKAGTVKGKAVTAGQRVKLNTGFPFTTTINNVVKHGYASTGGAWLDDGTTLANGTVVTRMDNFSTGTTSQVTAHVTSGQLDRQVTINQKISDIAGIGFRYNDYSQSSPKTYRVHFDTTTGHLMATATINNSSNSFSETALPVPKDLTDATNQYPVFINVSSFGSGNSESLQLPAYTAPAPGTIVQTTSTEAVSGGDSALTAAGGLTLYCWMNCPKGGAAGSGVYAQSATPYSYIAASSASGIVTITDNSNSQPVTGSSNNQVNMMQLTTTSTAPWNNTGTKAVMQYSYSAGNQWDSMVTFTNNADGSVVKFDQPLRFIYIHTTANDRNKVATYNGKTFPLTFDGFQLQGFPTMPDAHGNGWMLSAINLKDGVSLTGSNIKYVVRAMGIQQVPDLVANSLCSTAGLSTAGISTNLPLPTSVDLTAVPTTWANKPKGIKGLRVVEGVLQY